MFDLHLTYAINSNSTISTLDKVLNSGHSILSVSFQWNGWPTIKNSIFIELNSKFPEMGTLTLLNLTVQKAEDYNQWKDLQLVYCGELEYLETPENVPDSDIFNTRWATIEDINDNLLEYNFTPSDESEESLRTLADQIFHLSCSIAYTDIDEAQKKFLFDLLKKEAIALFDISDYKKCNLSYIRKKIKYFIKAGINAARNNIQLTKIGS